MATQTTKWNKLNSYGFIIHSSTLQAVHLTLINWHNWLCNVASFQCLEGKIFPKDSWALVHLLKECVTRHKKADQMPCVRLAFVLKRRDTMVLLALRFCLSYIGDLSFQLIPLMHSHDKMACSSSFNGSSSNRGGQKYFVYNQLQYACFKLRSAVCYQQKHHLSSRIKPGYAQHGKHRTI